MIEFIEGVLTEKDPMHAVVLTRGGVGYLLHISLHTFSGLPDKGDVRILTHLSVREDAHILYGFISKSERVLFRHLISVSGIGPNTARMVLSAMNPDELSTAIIEKDVNALKAVKGIGAKSAQRIIIDLRDKLEKDGHTAEISFLSDNTMKDEALSALVTLGFARASASRVVEAIVKNNKSQLTVEQLIKEALKAL